MADPDGLIAATATVATDVALFEDWMDWNKDHIVFDTVYCWDADNQAGYSHIGDVIDNENIWKPAARSGWTDPINGGWSEVVLSTNAPTTSDVDLTENWRYDLNPANAALYNFNWAKDG